MLCFVLLQPPYKHDVSRSMDVLFYEYREKLRLQVPMEDKYPYNMMDY